MYFLYISYYLHFWDEYLPELSLHLVIGTWKNPDWAKSVRIWSYCGPFFPTFGLNSERYTISLRIQSECEKVRIRITPNKGTFYAVQDTNNLWFSNLQDTVSSITLSLISTALLPYLKSFVPQWNKIYFGVFDISGCIYDFISLVACSTIKFAFFSNNFHSFTSFTKDSPKTAFITFINFITFLALFLFVWYMVVTFPGYFFLTWV